MGDVMELLGWAADRDLLCAEDLEILEIEAEAKSPYQAVFELVRRMRGRVAAYKKRLQAGEAG